MKPLKHQKKFTKGYKGSPLLAHEGGTGKTVCACLWLKDKRDKDALVVCPKKVIRKWQRALAAWGTKATVISKEEFKKTPFKKWSAVVIDEADEFAGMIFVGRQRSELAITLYNYVREYSPKILLLTGTPVRSTPWNLHSLLCFMNIWVPIKEFRDAFFELKKPEDRGYGYLQRPSYIPRPHWRDKVRLWLEKYADIVLLSDCVKQLPVPEIRIIKVKTPKMKITEDQYTFRDHHMHEQTEKLPYIKSLGKEFKKVLLVAYYRDQIEQLIKDLKGQGKDIFYVYGGVSTKKQEAQIEGAEKSKNCFFIVQASVGAGFDGDTFDCLAFASMSYSVRDYVQMCWRLPRIHNLHGYTKVFLQGGKCDETVYDHVQQGLDFVPSQWNPNLL